MLTLTTFVATGIGAFTWFAFYGEWGFVLLTWCVLTGIVSLGKSISSRK